MAGAIRNGNNLHVYNVFEEANKFIHETKTFNKDNEYKRKEIMAKLCEYENYIRKQKERVDKQLIYIKIFKKGIAERGRIIYGHSIGCMICHRSDSNCISVPCGHISYCKQCMIHIHVCPICKEFVTESVLRPF